MLGETVAETAHEIYPKQYFSASPTWFAWNKLTAHGVHSLQREPGFEGQRIFFHLNHPIQFVSVTGLASQIELGGGASAARYCFITLDDGSGKVLNIKINRRQDDLEYPSNTTVDELDIDVKLGLPTLIVNKKRLSVGQCIRVRGTLDSFRGIIQLDLKRIKLVDSTAEEVRAWTEIVQWRRILDEPWRLTDAARQKIDTDLKEEHRHAEERQLKKRAWHARQAEKRLFADRKSERLEAVYNDGALPGSEVIKAPWE